MSRDIILVDENFLDAAKEILDYGRHISEIARQYQGILEYILQRAIQDQNISWELQALQDQVKLIPEAVEQAVQEVHDRLIRFVEEVDQADQFLYQ